MAQCHIGDVLEGEGDGDGGVLLEGGAQSGELHTESVRLLLEVEDDQVRVHVQHVGDRLRLRGGGLLSGSQPWLPGQAVDQGTPGRNPGPQHLTTKPTSHQHLDNKPPAPGVLLAQFLPATATLMYPRATPTAAASYVGTLCRQ